MNIISQLTLRHLKQNKKRTLVTIIGVIISVAMVTAVTTLGVSFMDLMQRQTIADEGEWHVLYKDVNAKQLAAIQKDDATEIAALTNDRGYALLEGSRNSNKPYLFIKEYSTEGFGQFPVSLSSGRLPQNENEVIISEEIAENAKVEYRIGDQIKLDIGQRFVPDSMTEREDVNEPENGGYLEELSQDTPLRTMDGENIEELIHQQTTTFTIVGTVSRPTWEPTWAPGYTIIGFIDQTGLAPDETVDAAVVLNKVHRPLYSHARELAAQNDIKTVKFNNELLRYYGVTDNDDLKSTLNGLIVIILTIIIIGSVSLIYNAFAISVSERSRHLGMLSSVGATKKQKRNSVFFEGMIIGSISIPIGIISGLAGIGVTFWFINSVIQGALGVTENLVVKVTELSILSACVVSVITIFISTYIPARKASKISAIDAIRQSADIRLTGKTVRTSKLIRRLFGIEAEIGLKNLKRNRRRYQATVFSIIISIVLFLTVSYFTANLKKSLELTQDGVNYDIQVSINPQAEMNGRMIDWITSRSEVTEHCFIRKVFAKTWLKEEFVSKELRELIKADPSVLADGEFPYYLEIHAMDAKSLKAFAEASGANYEDISDPQKSAGLVIQKTNYLDTATGKYVEARSSELKAGQSIDVFYQLPGERGEVEYIEKVNIAALTDEVPMGVFPAARGGLSIIVSEEVMDRLFPDKLDYDIQTVFYMKSSDPMATQYALEDMQEEGIYVYNVYQNRQRDEQMILLMSVFTYGFIILITAICTANIFNTISTSIALRKREFAMLKSVGMTPGSFNRMINYESIFYGLKSLLYGLPLSAIVMFLIYRPLMYSFRYDFFIPWDSILFAVAAVFVIVGSAMLYSGARVKKENIIDALKQENI